MTNKKRILLFKVLVILFTYFILEVLCFIAITNRYIPAGKPTFRFVFKNPEYPLVWADIDSIWGNWHYKETFRQQTACLSIEYKINSYGARDKERAMKSSGDRIIVLGDSFLEGYGVDEASRVTNILEQKTGKEFLNFSCSDFGTTQEFLVYEHLAKKFDHSTILIGFLPYNDFENDDTDFKHTDRYRPYFVKSDTGYRIEYYNNQIWKSAMNKDSFRVASGKIATVTSRFLRAYTYWYNIVDYVRLKDIYTHSPSLKDNKVFSYYYDYKPSQMDKLEFVLSRLRNSANNKRIILFSIPTQTDLQRFKSDANPPLPDQIQRICSGLNIEYMDLMQPILNYEKHYSTLFLSCDPHWNEYGNRVAASILLEKFKF